MVNKNRIKIYDKSNIDSITLPNNPDAKYAFDYLKPMIENGVNTYIKNIHAEVKILVIDDMVLPINITNLHYINAYTASFYTHYISYTLEELAEIKNLPLKLLLQTLLKVVGKFLKLLGVDKTIYVNNWFLSTNLYPNLTKEQLHAITDFLKEEYSQYAIVFRSINDYFLKNLYSNLLELNYQMVISRQIYVFDKNNGIDAKWESRGILKKDIKLFKNNEYEITESLNDDELSRIVDLYNQLYLEKYTYLSPQFTREFIKLTKDKKLLGFKIFKKQNSIDAFTTNFERNNTLTGPLLGYQLDLPKNLGLYRMLTALFILEAKEKNYAGNMSSGVGEFKILRGCKPIMEYSAIYCEHLPALRQLAYKFLQKAVNDISIPLLCKNELCNFVPPNTDNL